MVEPIEPVVLLKKKLKEVSGTKIYNKHQSFKGELMMLEKLRDNLITDVSTEHTKQLGLKDKAKRSRHEAIEKNLAFVASNQALAFNLLGNNHITFLDSAIIPRGRYNIEYMRRLATVGATAHHSIMTIDACLSSPDKAYLACCNFDMLNWTFLPPCDIRRSYFDISRYNIGDGAKVFINALSAFTAEDTAPGMNLIPRFECFDAFQLIKQAMAIYGAIYEGMYEKVKEIKIIVCRWRMLNEEKLITDFKAQYKQRIAKYEAEFKEFTENIDGMVALFEQHGIKLSFKSVWFDELAAALKYNDKTRKLLDRYYI